MRRHRRRNDCFVEAAPLPSVKSPVGPRLVKSASQTPAQRRHAPQVRPAQEPVWSVSPSCPQGEQMRPRTTSPNLTKNARIYCIFPANRAICSQAVSGSSPRRVREVAVNRRFLGVSVSRSFAHRVRAGDLRRYIRFVRRPARSGSPTILTPWRYCNAFGAVATCGRADSTQACLRSRARTGLDSSSGAVVCQVEAGAGLATMMTWGAPLAAVLAVRVWCLSVEISGLGDLACGEVRN